MSIMKREKPRYCKFCRESLNKGAIKCQVCGEPFYFRGKIIKWAPVISALITSLIAPISIYIAYQENKGKQKYMETAYKVESESNSKTTAANLAILDLTQKLTKESKETLKESLHLPQDMTLQQLEQNAKATPNNIELQKKVFLYKALQGTKE